MTGFLFDKMVFGPVKSRRFGVSLGMNLLPTGYKYCTFNCIYCECGWTYFDQSINTELHPRKEIREALESKLIDLLENDIQPDNITFAGNGEPTIHPEFADIIDDTLMLRDMFFPETKVTVLSNSSMLQNDYIFDALQRIDNNVLKLDVGSPDMFKLINQPRSHIKLEKIIEQLKRFEDNVIIQSLFVRGTYNGNFIDNTTEEEVGKWLEHIKEIKPKFVMIYPISRATPAGTLEKISIQELKNIATKVEEAGVKTKVYF